MHSIDHACIHASNVYERTPTGYFVAIDQVPANQSHSGAPRVCARFYHGPFDAMFPMAVVVGHYAIILTLLLLVYAQLVGRIKSIDMPAGPAVFTGLLLPLTNMRKVAMPETVPFGSNYDYYGFFWALVIACVAIGATSFRGFCDLRPVEPQPGVSADQTTSVATK